MNRRRRQLLAVLPTFCLAPSIARAATTERPEAEPELRRLLLEAANASDSFPDRFDAEVWLTDMSGRLSRQVPEPNERITILRTAHYEARRAGLEPELVLAVIDVESNFDRYAVSVAGALGLMQVMPRTGRELGFESLHEPDQSVHAGVMYLYRLYNRLDEIPNDEDRLWFALAAYNAGLGHVNDARRLALELGRDPDVWFGEVAEDTNLASGADR